jgi:streptogramin lyase
VENVEPASNDSRSVREATEVPAGLFYMTSDPQGNVYFSYPKRAVVVKKSPEGQVLRVIRGFIRPEAIAVDEVGNVYVVDNGDVKICRARPGKPKASPSPAPKTSGQAKK